MSLKPLAFNKYRKRDSFVILYEGQKMNTAKIMGSNGGSGLTRLSSDLLFADLVPLVIPESNNGNPL